MPLDRPTPALHVLDADAPPDPLYAAVGGDDATLVRRLGHPVLRWRAARDLRPRLDRDAVAVAWGEAAADVARRAAPRRSVYRPSSEARRLALPFAGATAAADCDDQARRLERIGWPASQVAVVAPPVAATLELRRADLSATADDVLWLAAAEREDVAGIRLAVWAATILHVVEADRRRHRLVVVGDGPAQRLAKRFADQLGQPGLCIGTNRFAYADVAPLADAAVLLPRGVGGAYSAAIVVANALPAVINDRPPVADALAARPNVRVVADPKPRVIVREMLRLSDSRPFARLAPSELFSDQSAARQVWRELLADAAA